MLKNALFQNKKQLVPVSFVAGLFLILTVLVNPIYVSATSSPEIPIPFTLDQGANLNNWFYDNVSVLESDSDVSVLLNDSDYVFVPIDLSYYGYWDDWSWWWITILALPNEEFDTIDSENLYLCDLYPSFVSGKDCYFFNLWIDDRGNYVSHVEDFSVYSYPSDRYLFGAHNSQSIADIYTFVSSYPVSWQKDVYDSSGNLVLKKSSGSVIVQGHATAPDPSTSFLGNNADFGASISSSTFPNVSTVSHFTPNTYNPPSIDNSSVSSLLESLIDIVKYSTTYIIDGIEGFITSIITTIESYGQYVGSIIAYVGKAIITNIQYAIQNLYDNFVSLFEPILNFIIEVLSGIKTIVDEIISLGTDENGDFSLTTLFVNLAIPDPEDLQDLIEDSDTFNVISVFSTINTKVRQEYATLQGLSSQKIIHVPSCIYHGQEIGYYDIDFSWYDRYTCS